MNRFALMLKKLLVPKSNETKLVDAIQLWEVRWMSRYGEFATQTQPEIEVFTSEREAMAFAVALENAFKLIRHTSGTYVELNKAGQRAPNVFKLRMWR